MLLWAIGRPVGSNPTHAGSNPVGSTNFERSLTLLVAGSSVKIHALSYDLLYESHELSRRNSG